MIRLLALAVVLLEIASLVLVGQALGVLLTLLLVVLAAVAGAALLKRQGREAVMGLRGALDDHGLTETPIIAYSAKFASAFYGPFREAADSAPQMGDRRGYQMDPANGREAVREAALDGVRDELPHSITVVVEEMNLREDRPADKPLLDVFASMIVERDSQKGIIIGKQGARLRQIGSDSRSQIEKILGTPVYLDLHVKVAKDWQRDPKQLRKLGF